MNGLITRTLAAACFVGSLAAAGCSCWGTGDNFRYRDYVDVCYPERYNTLARREVMEAFAPQVQNGHILDQTIWNYHFEQGSDKLNAMGVSKLQSLTRRRPQPDATIYLATASDLTYDADHPEAMPEMRRELDSKRTAAVQRYLQSQMSGRAMAFEIMVHDPYEVGLPADVAARNVQRARTTAGGVNLGTGGQAGATQQTGQGGNQTGQMSGQNQAAAQTGGGSGSFVPR